VHDGLVSWGNSRVMWFVVGVRLNSEYFRSLFSLALCTTAGSRCNPTLTVSIGLAVLRWLLWLLRVLLWATRLKVLKIVQDTSALKLFKDILHKL
jgi:hypothetical protein